MICESLPFNSYKTKNIISFEPTTEKTENSSKIYENNCTNEEDNTIKIKNNYKLIDVYNPVVKNKPRNENINNASCNITKKVINNYLFITKNVFYSGK